jgi:hypothetical protein
VPRHCGFDPPDSADKLGPPVGKYALLHLTEIGGGKLLLVEGNRSWLTIDYGHFRIISIGSIVHLQTLIVKLRHYTQPEVVKVCKLHYLL